MRNRAIPAMSDMAQQRARRERGRGALIALALSVLAAPAAAQDYTHLVEVRAGSALSDLARDAVFLDQIYSDGSSIDMAPWYSSGWQDIQMTWLTEIDAANGVFWGFSTGEEGGKYRIDPGLTLGFLSVQELEDGWTVSLSTTFRFGGRLTEDPCTADYGEIGGIQTVNCRMSGSYLPPAETLDYLWDKAPEGQLDLNLRWELQF
jgi:hypothetical protein